MYKIFDISLPDDYIRSLTSMELSLLIHEAETERNRLEREIDELMWADNSRFAPENEGLPLPSEYSYDTFLYEREIEQDPALEGKLRLAQQRSEEVGLVMAVLASAQLQRAKIVSLENQVQRTIDRSEERFDS